MRRSTKVLSVLLSLLLLAGMLSCFTMTAMAAESDAAAEATKDFGWLILPLAIFIDVELIAIATIGICIAAKRRKMSRKMRSVFLPIALLAVTPIGSQVICMFLGVVILALGLAILYQIVTLRNLKNAKPAPMPAPQPVPQPAPPPPPPPAPAPIVEEAVIIEENVDATAVAEALAAPVVVLADIDYDDLEETEMEDGVEVISVVWPERRSHNKLYRYSPNGEKFESGDVVLVPTRDVMRERNVIRKAAVVRGNHFVDPNTLHHTLKKIVGRVKKS